MFEFLEVKKSEIWRGVFRVLFSCVCFENG